MLPKDLKQTLEEHIASVDHPRELAIDVMFALQDHYGYLSDEAVEETARMLDMTPLEVRTLYQATLQLQATLQRRLQ